MESVAVVKLPKYRYAPLSSPDSLRVLQLLPANDEVKDIDCQIIESSLDNGYDCYHNEYHDEYRNKEQRHDVVSTTSQVELLDSYLGNDVNSREKSRTACPDATEENQTKIVARDKKLQYEAVSWCWGQAPASQILRVHNSDRVFALFISPTLRNALWALRRRKKTRQLWIDAICINQKDITERNEQVARMDKIYGKASHVCIWLGDSSADSKLAIDFIREQVLNLWKFDVIGSSEMFARGWAALLNLMNRPWFSRRWVIQEIALSPNGGTIYCGKDSVSWEDFADAVGMFVETESYKDLSLHSAAILVDAISNRFRNSIAGERMPLSSLEFLVSQLSVFEATQPRDTIYALLAIAKETTPEIDPKGGFSNKAYKVDYRLPVIDVYQEFIEFSIRKAEKKKALDILCRAWAPNVMQGHDNPNFLKFGSRKDKKREKKMIEKNQKTEDPNQVKALGVDQKIPLPSWISGLNGAAFEWEEHPTAGLQIARQNADSLVGLPDESGRRNYTAAGDTELDLEKLEFRKWTTLKKLASSYPEYSMFVRGFIVDEVSTVEHLASNGNIPYRWLPAGGWFDTDKKPPNDFWRTLVADRAQNGRNPPTYFPRACKESMKFKAKKMSQTRGNLNCQELIDNGGCTIVAQFLRRVQEVIWNRKLMRTKRKHLGLVREDVSPGFKVCILYGCSVPVILEEIRKSPAELKAEWVDRYDQWYGKVKTVAAFCEVRYLLLKKRRKVEKPREEEETWSKTAAHFPRRTKGTWHLNNGELLASEKSSAPLERRSSFPNIIPEGIHTWDTNGAATSITGTPKKVCLPEEASTLPEKARSPPPKEGQALDRDQVMPKESGMPGDIHECSGTDGIRSDEKRHVSNTPAEARRPKTEKEKQDELELGRKLFDAEKRKQKYKVAQEMLNNLSHYRFVGECYVHGMMNGEAIKLQNEEHIPHQMFELR